jgi:hypothetical protein
MGLLDEAIREHLELRRRSGADPSLVAREEQEALASVSRDDDGELDADGGSVAEAAVDPAPVEHSEPEPVPAHELAPEPVQAEQPAAAMPMLSEETQELDMVATMADESAPKEDASSPTWSLAERLEAAEDAGEEPVYGSLDWDEIPDDDESHTAPEEIPGQEHLSFE